MHRADAKVADGVEINGLGGFAGLILAVVVIDIILGGQVVRIAQRTAGVDDQAVERHGCRIGRRRGDDIIDQDIADGDLATQIEGQVLDVLFWRRARIAEGQVAQIVEAGHLHRAIHAIGVQQEIVQHRDGREINPQDGAGQRREKILDQTALVGDEIRRIPQTTQLRVITAGVDRRGDVVEEPDDVRAVGAGVSGQVAVRDDRAITDDGHGVVGLRGRGEAHGLTREVLISQTASDQFDREVTQVRGRSQGDIVIGQGHGASDVRINPAEINGCRAKVSDVDHWNQRRVIVRVEWIENDVGCRDDVQTIGFGSGQGERHASRQHDVLSLGQRQIDAGQIGVVCNQQCGVSTQVDSQLALSEGIVAGYFEDAACGGMREVERPAGVGDAARIVRGIIGGIDVQRRAIQDQMGDASAGGKGEVFRVDVGHFCQIQIAGERCRVDDGQDTVTVNAQMCRPSAQNDVTRPGESHVFDVIPKIQGRIRGIRDGQGAGAGIGDGQRGDVRIGDVERLNADIRRAGDGQGGVRVNVAIH